MDGSYDGTNPLSFLEDIRHGNSLLGQRLEQVSWVPDDAIPKTWKVQRKANRDYNSNLWKSASKSGKIELESLHNELKAKPDDRAKSLTSYFGIETPENVGEIDISI